jgi:ATP-dependent Clp protease ATP-binding subunit ClpA
MPISQKQDAAQQQSEFKFYLAVEKLHQKVFRVSSLPPFKIERIGSNKSQLLGEVRRSLIKCFANWKPRTWAMPIPGSNPSFEPPAALTLRVDLKLTELGSSNTVPLDIGFVRWQVDEKHHAYHAPSLDRTWIGRASYWENGPLVSECLSEIEFRRKKRDLSFLQDWLFNRTIEVRVLRFPALLLSQPKADKDKTCTPVLNKTSNRISSWIRGNIYERDGLVDQVAEILFSKVAQSVLLVGEPGVGKTSIVQHLPKRHAALENLWSTSGSRLVSGQCGWGMWQRQFEALLKELRNTRGYLHVGSLVELVESGKLEDAPGVASRMKPELQRGNIRVIAECTPAQYQRLERNDPALLRCFLRVDVEELAPEKNLRLLERVAWDWLSERQAELEEIGYRQPIYMEPNTIQTIEALCRRFCRYSVMPSVPLRLIQSAISILESGSALSPSSMMQAFTAQTGMPRFLIDDQVPLEYEELRGKLANRVMGQDEAVDGIANLVITVKSRLQRPGKPLASFLFIGPTGVGKTEMAKSLAEVFFSESSRMVRLDMSEYATPESVGRLTGIRSCDSGTLTGPILDQPFSVILLDEIEKAHPSVFDVLLQVLGEGRLTDTAGRRADFRSSVIIMTSNLGVESFRATATGFGSEGTNDFREHFQSEVRRYVRPELLGRLDRIIPFMPLSRQDVRRIASRELQKLSQRPGISYGNMEIQATEELLDWIAQRGYLPQYGARPLRRAIEESIAFPLSIYLAENPSDENPSAGIRNIELSLQGNHVLARDLPKTSDNPIRPPIATNSDTKVHGTRLDIWRDLHHKSLLLQKSSENRRVLEISERICARLKTLGKAIAKAGKPTTRTDLIHQQDLELARLKKVQDTLKNVEDVVARIEDRYQRILKSYLHGDSIPLTDLESTELTNDLKLALTDLDSFEQDFTRISEGKSSIFYLGSDILQIRFLIDAHAKRFKAEKSYWVLFEYNKFIKLKNQGRFPKSDETNTQTWEEAGLAAVRSERSFDNQDWNSVIGIAREYKATRNTARFLDLEEGVHQLRWKKSGELKKLEYKVRLFPGSVLNLELPENLLDVPFASHLTPVRQYLPDSFQMMHMPTKTMLVTKDDDLKKAVMELLELLAEEALWLQLGFEPLPESSLASNPLFPRP